MPDAIIDGRGTGDTLKVNPDGSINTSVTLSSTGFTTNEIIRKASGSPAIDYVFSAVSEAFMIDNLGSSPIYFALDVAANPISQSGGFIDL
ncbi:MAG: hypothetical protein IH964_12180, partial [Candidatus Dadabacteria bacterium]|nr:hypothetical protein [Candidatus Dadabacteria bacterium]